MAREVASGDPASTPARPPVLSLGVSPTPFNPATEISYQLVEAGEVRLAVYSVQGRLVRSLVGAPQAAGEYAVTWDGTDTNGAAVANGTYFAELRVGSATIVEKLVVAR